MDSLPPQPRGLVEAVRRPGRLPQLAEQCDVGALRRCAPERKLEVHRLTRSQRPPAEEDSSRPLVEAAGFRRLVDLDDRTLDRPDAGDERAAVELRQPDASPRPAAERDGDRGSSAAKPSLRDRQR